MTLTCPRCGHSYESPVAVVGVWHSCPKVEAGKPKFVALRAAS